MFMFLNFVILCGCVGVPKNQGDACSIIKQKKSWKTALKKTQKKWGISPGMQLAFIKREIERIIIKFPTFPPKETTLQKLEQLDNETHFDGIPF